MSVEIKGLTQLRSRFEAIQPSPDLMRALAMTAIAEQKALVPRRTGNLGRSIGLGSVTPTYAETVATASYAIYVELGTKAHEIVPRTKKALRFAPGTGSTLAGRPRAGASVVFAKRVKHPGTKPRPYMVPGAQRAIRELGVEPIIKQWNDAA